MANLFQPSLQRATDNNGNPVSGAKMFFFLTGTTTPATWFTNQAGTVAGTNPLTADSSGKFISPAYLDPDAIYRVRLTESNGSTLIWPDVDPVRGYDIGMVQTAADSAIDAADQADASLALAVTARNAAQTAAGEAQQSEESAADHANDASLYAAAAQAFSLGLLFDTSAEGISSGVVGATTLVGGSGGTNGQFDLAFSGGAGAGAAGRFVVAGGAVTSIIITSPGTGYTSAPTISFAASSGLTGASATAVIGQHASPTEYYLVKGADSLALWRNVAGVATDQDFALPSIDALYTAMEAAQGAYPAARPNLFDRSLAQAGTRLWFAGVVNVNADYTVSPWFRVEPGTLYRGYWPNNFPAAFDAHVRDSGGTVVQSEIEAFSVTTHADAYEMRVSVKIDVVGVDFYDNFMLMKSPLDPYWFVPGDLRDLGPRFAEVRPAEGRKVAIFGDSMVANFNSIARPLAEALGFYNNPFADNIIAVETGSDADLNYGISGSALTIVPNYTAAPSNPDTGYVRRFFKMDPTRDAVIVHSFQNDWSYARETGNTDVTLGDFNAQMAAYLSAPITAVSSSGVTGGGNVDLTTIAGALIYLTRGLQLFFPMKPILYIGAPSRSSQDLPAVPFNGMTLPQYMAQLEDWSALLGVPFYNFFRRGSLIQAHVASSNAAYILDGVHLTEAGGLQAALEVAPWAAEHMVFAS